MKKKEKKIIYNCQTCILEGKGDMHADINRSHFISAHEDANVSKTRYSHMRIAF
jgi:hypothetical protein